MKKEVPFSIPLARARELLDTEVGAQVLGTSAVWVGQVLSVDTEAVGGVADAVALLLSLVRCSIKIRSCCGLT
jgi:hypothetical protein